MKLMDRMIYLPGLMNPPYRVYQAPTPPTHVQTHIHHLHPSLLVSKGQQIPIIHLHSQRLKLPKLLVESRLLNVLILIRERMWCNWHRLFMLLVRLHLGILGMELW
jgi:hypothetical protein